MEKCAICLEDVDPIDQEKDNWCPVNCPYNHKFHSACLPEWCKAFAKKRLPGKCTCPLCRGYITAMTCGGKKILLQDALALENELVEAAETGDLVRVNQIIPDTNVNAANAALIWAARRGHTEVVLALLGAGANVNTVDEDKITALIWASVRDHRPVVQALLRVPKINVNAADIDKNTALMLAAENDNLDVVLALLGFGGINVNAANEDKETALILAARNGWEKVVRALLSSGADANAADNAKETALILAARNGHSEVVVDLLKVWGINVDAENDYGETALIVAEQNGHRDVANAIRAAADAAAAAAAMLQLQDAFFGIRKIHQ